MKALSIMQPWTNLILTGHKTIEVRKRRTSHRGDLLLCSSKSPGFNKEGMDYFEELIGMPYLFGHALCVARLIDSRPMKKGDEGAAFQEEIDPKMCGWVLEAIRPVVPFEVKGQLGLYEIDDSLINASPYALWDCVRLRDTVDESELDFAIKGWYGRVSSIQFRDEDGWVYGITPDSISIQGIPLGCIEARVEEGDSWFEIWVKADELDRAEPRDTADEAAEAIQQIEREHPELFPQEEGEQDA